MYGWERFLSERDKQHDAIRGKKELYGFGRKPALMLIDIYYSVLGLKREPIFEVDERLAGQHRPRRLDGRRQDCGIAGRRPGKRHAGRAHQGPAERHEALGAQQT